MSENTVSHRLARRMVGPLRETPITPNHLTTLRLLSGLAAIVALGFGSVAGNWWGGILYLVSHFLDRADGELARAQNTSSAEGDRYDVLCDFVVNSLLFTGVGVGLSQGVLGPWAIAMGVAASIAIAVIYWARKRTQALLGISYLTPPATNRWFDPDDLLYLTAPIAWFGLLPHFLVGAAVGAPLFATAVTWRYLHLRRARRKKTDRATSGIAPGARNERPS